MFTVLLFSVSTRPVPLFASLTILASIQFHVSCLYSPMIYPSYSAILPGFESKQSKGQVNVSDRQR